MCKKRKCKKESKFEIVMQIPVWNHGCTSVLKYTEKSVFVYAKNKVKAVSKVELKHAILCVNKCKY